MRRIHWWSGAIGAIAIATATCVAPTAMAARSPSSASVASVVSRVQHDHRGHHVQRDRHGQYGQHGHRGHRGHRHYQRGCAYPPSGTPQVGLQGPSRIRAKARAPLSGIVKINSCGYQGFPTGLFASTDGRTGWTQVSTTTSDAAGAFGFTYSAEHSVYLRAVVAGGDGYGPAESAVLFLKVRSHQR